MTIVSISPRFRITIPKSVRMKFDLKAGDNVAFLKRGEELVIVRVPKKPLVEMAGMLDNKSDIRKILKQLKEEDLSGER